MRTIFVWGRGLGAIAVVLMATGCVTTFRDYPVQPAASYKHHLEQDGVIVAVRPLTKASEQRKYFDTNLNSRDILPVFVVVENHSPETNVVVSKEGMELRGGSSQATADRLPSSDGARVVSVALLGSPLFTAIAANADNVRYNFRAKELTRQMLSTNEATSGFIYFPLSVKDRSAQAGLFMSVKLQMPPSNEYKTFLIEMTN